MFFYPAATFVITVRQMATTILASYVAGMVTLAAAIAYGGHH